jgi:hypothetical protein
VLSIDSAQLLRNFAAQSPLWSSLHTTTQTSAARSVAITVAESLLVCTTPRRVKPTFFA